jgi:hypothetical protein
MKRSTSGSGYIPCCLSFFASSLSSSACGKKII